MLPKPLLLRETVSLTSWCPAGIFRIWAAGARCCCLHLESVKLTPRWRKSQRAAMYLTPQYTHPASRSSELCSLARASRAAGRTYSRRPKRHAACGGQPSGGCPRPAATASRLGAGLRKPREPFCPLVPCGRSGRWGQRAWLKGDGGGEEPGQEEMEGPRRPRPCPAPPRP